MNTAQTLLLVAVLTTAIGAFIDLRTGQIPNWLTGGALGFASIAHAGTSLLAGRPLRSAFFALAISMGGAALCFAVPFLLHWRGAMGGGDVKLFAAVGALCHPLVGFRAQLYSFIFGAAMMLALMAYKGQLTRLLRNVVALVRPRGVSSNSPAQPENMTALRFGPSIFVGTLISAYLEWSAI